MAFNIAHEIQTATTERNGALHWNSNNRPVPLDCFRDAKLTAPAGQAAAIQADTAAFLAEYRRNYTGPSAEDRAEARAALGPGRKVVNVITGHTFRT